tara:strand:+ start:439 stop:831 length:393 start_codon:yes stop_codon:yes gene_type:complete
MAWSVELRTRSGNVVAYKDFSRINDSASMTQLAQDDCNFLRQLHEQHNGNVVHVIDVTGIKPSKRVFQYLHAALRVDSTLPKHCYVIGVSKITHKIFKAVRKLMSKPAAQMTTLHEGTWNCDIKQEICST